MINTKIDHKKVQSVEKDLLNNELYLHDFDTFRPKIIILWR
jgi:hypothetical protein